MRGQGYTKTKEAKRKPARSRGPDNHTRQSCSPFWPPFSSSPLVQIDGTEAGAADWACSASLSRPMQVNSNLSWGPVLIEGPNSILLPIWVCLLSVKWSPHPSHIENIMGYNMVQHGYQARGIQASPRRGRLHWEMAFPFLAPITDLEAPWLKHFFKDLFIFYVH